MGEVAVSREYRFTFTKPHQSVKMATNLSKALKETISSNICDIVVQPHRKDPSRITVEMTCVDGTAVHEADKHSMSRIMQYCERNAIKHKIGELQVKTE
jgi:hypothetical protein